MDPLPPLPVRQDSTMRHLTPEEGIPEELSLAQNERASSAACSFTHIEGVLERLTIAKSSRQETPRISVISDIEGIPERQWIFSVRVANNPRIPTEMDQPLSKRDEGRDSTNTAQEVSRGTVHEPLHPPIICDIDPQDDETTQQSEMPMPVPEEAIVHDVEMETAVTMESIPPMEAVSNTSHHQGTANASEISSSSVLDRQTLPREESFAPMGSDGFTPPAAPAEPFIVEGHIDEEKRSSLLGKSMQICLECILPWCLGYQGVIWVCSG